MNPPQTSSDQAAASEAAPEADGALDDRIVDLMVYLCEVLPPEALR